MGQRACALQRAVVLYPEPNWQKRESAMRNILAVTAISAVLLLPLDSLAARHMSGAGAGGGRLAQLCNEGRADIAGLPVEQYQAIVAQDEAKRSALDALAKATVKAAQDINAACQVEIPPTAPGRLAGMQRRIEAMNAAVATVKLPLERFYGLLGDEQKEEIVALAQRERRGTSLLDQDCGSMQTSRPWPTARIDRAVHPSEAQRASLGALADAAARAAEMSKPHCAPENFLTPIARLDAVGRRLDALLQAVKALPAPLDDFYAMLDNQQKAKFDAISLGQTRETEQPKAKPASEPQKVKPATVHRHHFASVGYFFRHFLRW
jgi:hypothetical protein